MKRSKIGSGSSIRRAIFLLALPVVGLGLSACDFLDPTAVENPRTTTEDLARALEPTAAMVSGLRAQFARLLSSTVTISEVVSDNYSIHGTGISTEFDRPREITPILIDMTGATQGIYWNAQELRALAHFVLTEIVPGDEAATAGDIAWAHYYRGMAYLFLGENFSYAPIEEDGLPLPHTALLERAIADLTLAGAAGGDVLLPATAALARAYRLDGDASAAEAEANRVLAGDPEFLWIQGYDASSITNGPWSYLTRALQDMQPHPRLDFLDPKFVARDAGIPVAKAEEMHLILAEAALVRSDYGVGKTHLGHAIRIAQSRAVVDFVDTDTRTNRDLTFRPRDASIRVRADADSPYRDGLVVDRNGATVQVPTVSGTSLDADSIEALPDAEPQALWHALYLARQEIFFLEGRRMADLGIRLPMMQREIDTNPNIDDTSPGTAVVVPSYIPPADELDSYNPPSPYDGEVLITTLVTGLHDMNRVLAQNLVSPFL